MMLAPSNAHTVWHLALFISRHQALRLCRELNLQSSSEIMASIQIPYDFGQDNFHQLVINKLLQKRKAALMGTLKFKKFHC
jgi:hypothetical protein